MIQMLGVERPQWSTGSASFLVDAFTGLDPPRARRVRGTIDLRFSDVEEDYAYENPMVLAFLTDLYDRAPWAAYFIAPIQDQLELCLVAHGAWVETVGEERLLMADDDVVTAVENMLLAAGVYAVERGDDWRQVVEPWAAGVAPDLTDDVRVVLAGMYDRHGGLRLTASGWIPCE